MSRGTCAQMDGIEVPAVLSPAECQQIIADATAEGFHKSGVKERFAGQRLRTTLHSPELAALLWKRLEPSLGPRHFDGMNYDFVGNHSCVVSSGMCQPHGVNELLRVSKYEPGGCFRKHVDSVFCRNEEDFGLLTVLIYLNDDYEGGETVMYLGGKDQVVIKPEVGKVFAFYHYQMHAGLEIRSGCKYIVRTEIMYHRVDEHGRKLSNPVLRPWSDLERHKVGQYEVVYHQTQLN